MELNQKVKKSDNSNNIANLTVENKDVEHDITQECNNIGDNNRYSGDESKINEKIYPTFDYDESKDESGYVNNENKENAASNSETDTVNVNNVFTKFSQICPVVVNNDTDNNNNNDKKITNTLSTPNNLIPCPIPSIGLNFTYKRRNENTIQLQKKKRRKRNNEKIDLREYCDSAIVDFPLYGITAMCSICNDCYDINQLFKDNRCKSDEETKYICLYCSVNLNLDDIKDWDDKNKEKKRQCKRCKSKKGDRRFKNGSIKYCVYCALKKNRFYARSLLGLEKVNNNQKNNKDCNDISNNKKIDIESVRNCDV